MRFRAALPILLCFAPMLAWADPFPKGDPLIGKKLVTENHCAACHAQKFGGDGSRVYTRADRKVTTPQKLAAQITICAAQLNLALFPDDEEHIAAYLNREYYKFK
ncbi:MAG: hypothetical protein WA373_13490 [Burkholderiales bacterium]